MKTLLLFCSVFLFATYSFGQQANSSDLVDLDSWAAVLNLDQYQTSKVNTIEYQRAVQLQELATIKNSDVALYNNKLQAINANTLAKLRNLLRPEQLNIYQQEVEKREKAKVATAKQMRTNGATKSEIDNFLNNKK